MISRGFCSHIDKVNKEWLGSVLGLEPQYFGPDLVDELYSVELKSRLIQSDNKHHRHFVVHRYEHEEMKEITDSIPLYALMYYGLKKPVAELSSDEIKSSVTERKIFFTGLGLVEHKINEKSDVYVYVNPSDLVGVRKYVCGASQFIFMDGTTLFDLEERVRRLCY